MLYKLQTLKLQATLSLSYSFGWVGGTFWGIPKNIRDDTMQLILSHAAINNLLSKTKVCQKAVT